jgi:hypothetical protein
MLQNDFSTVEDNFIGTEIEKKGDCKRSRKEIRR